MLKSKPSNSVPNVYTVPILFVSCQAVDFLFFLSNRYVLNDKLIFGLIGNNNLSLFVSLLCLSIIFKFRGQIKVSSLWLSLILAGTVSNLFDRFVYDGTIDYINLYAIPTFNLADILIVTGCVLLALQLLKNENDNKKTA